MYINEIRPNIFLIAANNTKTASRTINPWKFDKNTGILSHDNYVGKPEKIDGKVVFENPKWIPEYAKKGVERLLKNG